MKRLFLDIETLPADKKLWQRFVKDYELKVELKKKKPLKKEDVYLKTALDGTYGRILCIGYLKEPAETKKAKILSGTEKSILQKFWQVAKDVDLFIGHNVIDFDLKFIYKRSVIHNVKPTKFLNFARYRNFPIYDTMYEWEKWTPNAKITLDELAKVLNLQSSKQGIDGSKVFDFYEKGKLKEIYEYCQRDVELTREIYRKMVFEGNK